MQIKTTLNRAILCSCYDVALIMLLLHIFGMYFEHRAINHYYIPQKSLYA